MLRRLIAQKALLASFWIILTARTWATPTLDLWHFVIQKDVAGTKAAISAGADVNDDPEHNGFRPILYTIIKGDLEFCKILLDNKASINFTTHDWGTPLSQSLASGKDAIFFLLLERGADLDLTDENGRCALLNAVSLNQLVYVDALLKRGANPNLADRTGLTPLLAACYKGQKRMVSHLLAQKANPEMADASGTTPLQVARTQNFPEIEKLLQDAGATK